MGQSVGIFRNFQDCFRTVRVEFRDYFQTIRVEFLGLFSNSPNMIFGTIFGQSRNEFKFGVTPGTDVFGFCGVFWYHSNPVTNREGTKRYPVLCGSEIWAILCVMVGKY